MTASHPWIGLAAFAARIDLWNIIGDLGGPVPAEGASRKDWQAVGLPLDAAEALAERRVDPGGITLCPTDPAWPAALTGTAFGPVLLGAMGNLLLLNRPGVAIVGSRACTPYGVSQASSLSRAVGEAGGVVVSGLARGIDKAAHLAAPGATIAVLGQGLDAPMPTWQRAVAERILEEGGLVLSEFPRALQPDRWTFPVRNRVVAGLARAVVVVEADHKSGARNTAAHGARLGREVLAVPGALGWAASNGCLDLIEEGAGVVRGTATVLRAAGLQSGSHSTPADPVAQAVGAGATAEQVMLLTGLPWAEVSAKLSALTLTGRLVRLAGGIYVPRGRP